MPPFGVTVYILTKYRFGYIVCQGITRGEKTENTISRIRRKRKWFKPLLLEAL